MTTEQEREAQVRATAMAGCVELDKTAFSSQLCNFSDEQLEAEARRRAVAKPDFFISLESRQGRVTIDYTDYEQSSLTVTVGVDHFLIRGGSLEDLAEMARVALVSRPSGALRRAL